MFDFFPSQWETGWVSIWGLRTTPLAPPVLCCPKLWLLSQVKSLFLSRDTGVFLSWGFEFSWCGTGTFSIPSARCFWLRHEPWGILPYDFDNLPPLLLFWDRSSTLYLPRLSWFFLHYSSIFCLCFFILCLLGYFLSYFPVIFIICFQFYELCFYSLKGFSCSLLLLHILFSFYLMNSRSS